MIEKLKKLIKETTSGFTLTELIIIIILIGIFATMAMMRTRDGVSTIQQQIAIDQITSDIDLVKSMAFAKHDTITIVFSTNNEQYTIFVGPDGSRTALSDFPNSNNGVISFDNATFRNVNISNANFSGTSELQFLPLGEPKSGGSIVLNTKTISIENVTGKWSIN
tara:strand:+ start:780 stop:1274 length:495 start_codon:yes stop_codon:yes gene_type:complete